MTDPTPIAERITAVTGLRFDGVQHSRMMDSLTAAMRRLDVTTPADLEHDPRLLDRLVEFLTVHETYFFREPHHFEVIADEVLRDRIGGGDGPLRVWSAGCASGEEPYSVAIALAERGLLDRARILGTDLSGRAIARGRAATYSAWSLRRPGVSTAWFARAGTAFRLDARIVERVELRVHNLIDGPPVVGGFDAVLCRNVLMYLTSEGVAAAVRTLHDALAPGGWLLVGAADPLLEHEDLDRVGSPNGVVYRRRRPASTDAHAPAAASRTPRVIERRRPRRPPAPQPAVEQPATPEPEPAPVATAIATAESLAARGKVAEALVGLASAIGQHPLDAGLRHVEAVLHLLTGQPGEAARAASAAVYLDPSLVAAHALLGQATLQLGEAERAHRSFRRAETIASSLPADAELPFTDGARAGDVAAALGGPDRKRLAP